MTPIAISKKNLLLLMVGIDSDGQPAHGIGGITRLQKLLFLLEKESGAKEVADTYIFEPYKAGPYSKDVYDELEFLENLGLISSTIVDDSSAPERSELQQITYEELLGEGVSTEDGGIAEGPGGFDAFEERSFKVTDDGRRTLELLLASGKYRPAVDAIRKIKSRFGNYSLNDLLYHVYTKYPEMATESEIKQKVLKRRREF